MLTVLTVAALMIAGDPARDPDAVVTTAPRDAAGAVLVGAVAPTSDARPDAAAQAQALTPHDLTTDEQIDRWLSARSPESQPFAGDQGPVDDRQMHGFVSGAIGTHDFNSVSVGVSLPVGETGRVDLTYSRTENGYGYPGYGYGYPGPGIDYPGYAYGSRPFGGFDSFHGAPSRSGRSVSLGFSSDERRSRDPAAPLRSRGVTAQD